VATFIFDVDCSDSITSGFALARMVLTPAMVGFATADCFDSGKTDLSPPRPTLTPHKTAKFLFIFNILKFYDHEIKIGSLIP
jgi:hypothetical protein